MSHYIERLRVSGMHKGVCGLNANHYGPLEENHESYAPERTIFVCHDCHWRITFEPWLLTKDQRRKLLNTRYAGSVVLTDDMIAGYKSPSRKAAGFKPHKN